MKRQRGRVITRYPIDELFDRLDHLCARRLSRSLAGLVVFDATARGCSHLSRIRSYPLWNDVHRELRTPSSRNQGKRIKRIGGLKINLAGARYQIWRRARVSDLQLLILRRPKACRKPGQNYLRAHRI